MKAARLVVLVVAVAAGGVAALLAGRGGDEPPPPAPVQTVKMDTVDILVARGDINLGQAVSAQDLLWQQWPTQAASPAFVRRTEKPDAIEQLSGAIARSPFVAGEPIREAKLIKANGSGYMAAVLDKGMRAVSTEISPETGAGGFILPNDRVDVILSKREKNPDRNLPDIVSSETVLVNVRVLAIDQAPKEKDGTTTLVGKTATLEIKPEQAETLARARQSGTLSLALRSIADANVVDQADDLSSKRGESINVVRYGIASPQAMQK